MTLWIAGTGARLGRARPVVDATGTGQVQVAEAEPEALAVDYAVSASRDALANSGHRSGQVGMLVHQVALGGDLPPLTEPAFYMQRKLALGAHCRVTEMRYGCNGLGALEWVADRLTTGQHHPAALISAADVWRLPVVDRSGCSSGFMLGDGAGAWVVSRFHGWASIDAVAYRTDPELEGMSRGDEWRGERPLPVSLARRAREFGARMTADEQGRRKISAIRGVVNEALEKAGTGLDAVRWVVVPHLAGWLTDRDICEPLGIARDRTTWHIGRRVGHLGAADVLVGLHYLRGISGSVMPGDQVMAIAYGSGFTFSSLVLTVERSTPPEGAFVGVPSDGLVPSR